MYVYIHSGDIDRSTLDQLREVSRQHYLEKREEKELILLEKSLRDERVCMYACIVEIMTAIILSTSALMYGNSSLYAYTGKRRRPSNIFSWGVRLSTLGIEYTWESE